MIVDVSRDAPNLLDGDPLRLRQILVNLASNAFKFTNEGEIVIRVETALQRSDRALIRFTVSDTGTGIDPKQLDSLFEAFTQGDTSTSRKYGGTGLGLSISQQLVLLMGGTGIQVDSRPGEGSSFTFTVPFGLSRTADKDQRAVPEKARSLPILVVEDNESSRQMLERMLSAFGLECRTAATAEEALNLLAHTDGQLGFSLVLMDWKLPGLDGLTAARRILADQSRSLPVIMMSAYAREREILQAEEIGIRSFLFKPIKQSSLFDAIMENLGYPVSRRSKEDLALTQKHLKGVRLLLVEDNEANQMVAVEILTLAGFKVEVAANGRLAVEALRGHDYDLVLMDLHMPEMDGFEATAAIRNELGLTTLPIIAMTANVMKGERERCLAAGMDDYVSKPIDRAELLRTLSRWAPAAAGSSAGDEPLSADEAEEAPPELDGVDTARGLKQLGLPWSSFRRLLVRFPSGQDKVMEQLGEAVKREDTAAVVLQAHSLSGAAGNIAARDLRAAARELEAAARSDRGGLAPLWERVLREYETVKKSLTDLAAATAEKETSRVHPAAPLLLLGKLDELALYLEDFDPVGAGRIADELGRSAWSENLREDFEKLCEFIQDLRYDEAVKILASLKRGIKEEAGDDGR